MIKYVDLNNRAVARIEWEWTHDLSEEEIKKKIENKADVEARKAIKGITIMEDYYKEEALYFDHASVYDLYTAIKEIKEGTGTVPADTFGQLPF